MVTVIAVFGLTDLLQYVWFAFAGVVVFGLASIGRGAGNPLTLVLAGQGITVFLTAMTTGITLSDQKLLNALRFWNSGSVAGVRFNVIWPVTACVAVGLMVAHVARYLTGPDYRWLVPYAGVLGAVVLLVCDIVGRLVVRPGELDAGVAVALLGAPFFAVLVWRGKFKSA